MAEQERYAHGLKYSLYDTVTSLVLGLASAVVTARVFGVEVIGAFALAALLTGSLHMVSNVREQGGLVRELTRHPAGAPESRALLWLVLGFSAALTLAILVPFSALSVWLLRSVFEQPDLVAPFFVLAGAYLLLDNTSFNLDAPLVAYRDGRAVWIVRMAITATMILGALVCALADERSLWALVGITVAASAVGVLLRLRAVGRLTGLRTGRREIEAVRGRLRPIVWFGIRQTPLNYTETAIEYADTAVLGASVPLASVGAYSRAYTLYRRAGQVPVALSRLYFPTLTALFHRGERDAMLRVHRLSTRYLTLLLLPAATWLAAGAPAVLAIFGPGFDAGATALSILIFAVVLDGYGRDGRRLPGRVRPAGDRVDRVGRDGGAERRPLPGADPVAGADRRGARQPRRLAVRRRRAGHDRGAARRALGVGDDRPGLPGPPDRRVRGSGARRGGAARRARRAGLAVPGRAARAGGRDCSPSGRCHAPTSRPWSGRWTPRA